MHIKRYKTGPLLVNTYIVADEKSKEAIIIDLGGSWDSINRDIKEFGLKLKYVLLTHGHFDHILGIPEMRNTSDAVPVLMSKEDRYLTDNVADSFKRWKITMDVAPVKIDRYIDETTELFLGEHRIKILKTPGHTKGGLSFLIDGNLFSGDTLFRFSIGRTDLEFGNYEQLISGIKTKLMTLPDTTVVFPGHESKTTIGEERLNNQFIK